VLLNKFLRFRTGHFQYARYIDGLLDLRIKALTRRAPHTNFNAGTTEHVARSPVVDKVCQRYILLAIKHYGEAVKLGMKHVFQALPRLLSLWFDFTSLYVTETSSTEPSSKQSNGHGE
jgi:serine/threonine-protein kinase ATR